MSLFKIRASQAYKIYSKRWILTETAKTYLKEYVAGDNEQIRSKYFAKGSTVEEECIEFAAKVLDLGFLSKNQEQKEDDYFTGCPDIVLNDCIIDVKSPWNIKTLHDHVLDPVPMMYYLQLQIYMHLFKKSKSILFYGLMDTPIEIGFNETNYESLPDEQRWFAYQIDFNQHIIDELIQLVIESRKFITSHQNELKNVLGKLKVYGESNKNAHLGENAPFEI